MFFSKTNNDDTIYDETIECNGKGDINYNNLKRLYSLMSNDSPKFSKVRNKVKVMKSGRSGEKNVLSSLTHCGISPMLILHDIHFPLKNKSCGTTSQIDYIIITLSNIILLECKNFSDNCNLEITLNGHWIAKYKNNIIKLKNPVTQNAEHLKTLFSIIDSSGNRLMKKLKNKDGFFQNFCVISGYPNLDNNMYTNDVTKNVIQNDDIINRFKVLNNNVISKAQMIDIKDFFLQNQVEGKITNWFEKFNISLNDLKDFKEMTMYKNLQAFRKQIASHKEIDCWKVFKNDSMKQFIMLYYQFNPKDLDELLSISDFLKIPELSVDQIQEYGDSIIEILKKH